MSVTCVCLICVFVKDSLVDAFPPEIASSEVMEIVEELPVPPAVESSVDVLQDKVVEDSVRRENRKRRRADEMTVSSRFGGMEQNCCRHKTHFGGVRSLFTKITSTVCCW